MGDHGGEPAGPRGVPHGRGLRGVKRKGLLTEHMLARSQRGQRHVVMGVGWRCDGHRVEAVERQQRAKVGEGMGDSEAIGGLAGPFLALRHHRHHLQALRLEGGDVHRGPEPDADDADPQWPFRLGHVARPLPKAVAGEPRRRKRRPVNRPAPGQPLPFVSRSI